MRLIDADTLWMVTEGDHQYYEKFEIENAPPVDAVSVKHGHWEVVDGTEPRRYGCSVCKRLSWTEDNYCSYCGTKMDEVTEDETN